ncbi:4,5-dihydroxyphthalate decarboxylase [Paraburkholderia tropica]|uniref:ABC transporter substrate-binding protein n=1 Tax=Paraburkholderia tropica TaxID=92647 RepID=UPI001CB10BD6|nr:ABC transporter substrate-binding protein [Paraburkholderia tropica]CAG9201862.1 4,5-dihydroxyphthalate decarboxylase [Paraburkholderia tropica]
MHPVVLKAALKTYPHTQALKAGELSDPAVELRFEDVEPIHRAFAPMARRQEYDVSELAIVSYLQAKAYGKPVVLLPAVVAARFQQGCLIYDAQRAKPDIGHLAGKRIGVRTYAQTTGMWVRAILREMYGVPLEEIEWVTIEGGHLEEYADPAFVRRADAGKQLLPMLRAGEIDAAILGNDLPDGPEFKPLIDDAAAADREWYGRHRYVPINHVVVVTQALADSNPQAVRAVYDLLLRGKESVAAQDAGKANKLLFGYDALREPLAETIAYCEQQGLLPRKLTVEEIFADSMRILGDAAR